MNVLSLFSGAGGMDLGLEGNFNVLKYSIDATINSDWIETNDNDYFHLKPTEFKTIFANDIRPDAKRAWTNYFGQFRDVSGIYHLDSIVDLIKREEAGDAIFPKNIDLITGGFPCNDFSISGKRRGFNSVIDDKGKRIEDYSASSTNRGELYSCMIKVIDMVKPKMFIAENVKGLTNLESTFDKILNDFSSLGNDSYLITPPKILKTWEYGIPQNRERLIFFGFNKSALTDEALKSLSSEKISKKYDPYPETTHGIDKLPIVTSEQALIGLDEPDDSNDPAQRTYSKAKFMGKHCQGQTEISLDKCAPTIRAEHHGNIEYRRLSEEHGGKHLEELKLNLPERRLTVRECARIQTFPDEYEFILKKDGTKPSVSGSSAYKLIGNAVPPLLAYHIAQNLQKKWDLLFK